MQTQQLNDFEIIKNQMEEVRLFLIQMLKQQNPRGYKEYLQQEETQINLNQEKN